MSVDKSREQFEEYLKNKLGNKKSLYVKFLTKPNSSGGFQSNHSQQLWEAWQASRSAIEIEFPGTDEADTKSEMLDCCIQAVEDTGLKVKK